jgi:hypothetical protein
MKFAKKEHAYIFAIPDSHKLKHIVNKIYLNIAQIII